ARKHAAPSLIASDPGTAPLSQPYSSPPRPLRWPKSFLLRVVATLSPTLPSEFRQITPAKPKSPPAANIQKGLSFVAKASAAATIESSAATLSLSEVGPKIGALAPIRPMDSETSAAWTIAGQRDALERRKKPLT